MAIPKAASAAISPPQYKGPSPERIMGLPELLCLRRYGTASDLLISTPYWGFSVREKPVHRAWKARKDCAFYPETAEKVSWVMGLGSEVQAAMLQRGLWLGKAWRP